MLIYIWCATRVFAFGEDTLVLRLTSKLIDLRTGYANRILWHSHRARCEARVAAPDNPAIANCSHICSFSPIKNQSPRVLPLGLSGAATRIRTGDLILTKDVLYQLSHSSITQGCFLVTQIIISNIFVFVNTFFKKIENYFSREFSVITLSITALISPVKTR